MSDFLFTFLLAISVWGLTQLIFYFADKLFDSKLSRPAKAVVFIPIVAINIFISSSFMAAVRDFFA